MKKFFVSAGLVAIGAAALESALADDATGPKYWSVGATLRGFYDDNYNISSTSKGSGGIEFLPTVSMHVPLQQTDLGIRYTYGLYYYQDRQDLNLNPFDQTHQLDLWIDHAFNERWHARVNDTFASGQEPELLTPNPVQGSIPYRVDGDNIANHGNVELDTQWTRLLSTSLTYNNGFYDYQNSGTVEVTTPGTWNGTIPINAIIGLKTGSLSGASLAGLLDRDEESIALDLKWDILEETTAFVGYQFSFVNYLGNEPVQNTFVPDPKSQNNFVYHSADRNNFNNTVYLGVQQVFTPNLTANVKAGISYVDVYADPLFPTTTWEPYADLSATWTYLPGSYVQFGFTQDTSSSDIIAADSTGHITQFAEDSVIYLDVNHAITSKLTATAIGRLQYSTYNQGADSNDTTTDYGLGVNFTYQFDTHWSADLGYNYDNVVSGIAGYGFTRNRVYIGVTGTY